MGLINTILLIVTILVLCIILYFQVRYVQADWCSYEIEKGLFMIEEILNEVSR